MTDLHYGSGVYSTPRDLAFEMIYDWLSAGDLNVVEDVLAGSSDADLVDEMWREDWTHEAVDRNLALDVMEDIRRSQIRHVISEIRDELEMTQSEMADRLGISQAAVAQWETGSTLPSLHQIGALRRLVGGDVGERLLHLI